MKFYTVKKKILQFWIFELLIIVGGSCSLWDCKWIIKDKLKGKYKDYIIEKRYIK